MTKPALDRRFSIGAELAADTARFCVWAPKRRRVEVILFEQHMDCCLHQCLGLRHDGDGYFSGAANGVVAGMLYGFRLDGGEQLWPDPASRFQPQGPDGLSQLIDPRAFDWSDAAWPGLTPHGQVFYELHVGTFTPEGTWASAAEQLKELAELGITCIEVMPVADFPGTFGWGYDGVNLFAPTRLYGQPDEMRRFVDTAHRHGVGVILDVVYNHFGNLSNTLGQFSDYYTTDRYANEWGSSNNFDGEHSQPVREFFLANVRYWIEEFHLDGFRFDATQAIHDASEDHILSALAREARAAAGHRPILLVAENEPQDARLVRPRTEGGHGMDMIWNDDFHHAAAVRLTGRNEAYYSDYRGEAEEFLAALKHGFLYQGQYSTWQGKPRGTPTRGLPQWAFVNYLETHDQVANSARGTRLCHLTSPGCWRAMTVLWLLSPQTLLLFQGQEFGSSADFLFFADHEPAFRQIVADGRRSFLAQFPSINTPEMRDGLADPGELATFERCRLDFRERERHRSVYDLHRDLLRLRREDAVFSQQRSDLMDCASYGQEVLIVRYFGDGGGDRLSLINFGRDQTIAPAPQPLLAPPIGQVWQLLFSSESPRYGGRGTPPLHRREGWFVPGESAVVLQSLAAGSPPVPDLP